MPPMVMKTLVNSNELPQATAETSATMVEGGKMIKSATGTHISPTSCMAESGTQTPAAVQPGATNFPRNTKNRQTFHGKTEHTKVGS